MPNNLIIIMTDELRRDVLSCYGNSYAKTPNINKLAQNGTIFTNAYTPSPICVPARASIATGQYVHQNKCWTNAMPYSILKRLEMKMGFLKKYCLYMLKMEKVGYTVF